MKILILGGDGMLGHQLYRSFGKSHEVKATVRKDWAAYERFGVFERSSLITDVDVTDFQKLKRVTADFSPDCVINAVGVIKQRAASKESIPSLEVNALLPHRLALVCAERGTRFVHFSTDCVFSGTKGNYLETDPSDAQDLYGKTKFLGEVGDEGAITLRTSIIGPELDRKKSLLEWFLAQNSQIKGYKRAIFTGFTTLELSRILERILAKYPSKSGVYQVSSEPINKFDLLCLIKDAMNLKIDIIPDETFYCDRSLDSQRFRKEFDYQPPAWKKMIGDMVEDMAQMKRSLK